MHKALTLTVPTKFCYFFSARKQRNRIEKRNKIEKRGFHGFLRSKNKKLKKNKSVFPEKCLCY